MTFTWGKRGATVWKHRLGEYANSVEMLKHQGKWRIDSEDGGKLDNEGYAYWRCDYTDSLFVAIYRAIRFVLVAS